MVCPIKRIMIVALVILLSVLFANCEISSRDYKLLPQAKLSDRRSLAIRESNAYLRGDKNTAVYQSVTIRNEFDGGLLAEVGDIDNLGEPLSRTATGGFVNTIMVALTVFAFLGNGAFMVYVFWLSK